jgi:cell division protease FtsH
VKLGASVDLMRLARQTPGFSGADLAAIINESALIATMGNKEAIDMSDLEEARDKLRWGKARKSRVIDEKEKAATAYHEAGHAVIQYLERENADPIHKVTIIPRGRMGGATMTLPEKDRNNYSRKWSLSFLKMGLAGRIAEEMFTGDINTGAGGDIRQVTSLARAMVRDWGMSERVGFVFYGEDENKMSMFGMASREYSEETAKIIDEEVKKLIDRMEADTKQVLEAHRDRVEALAQALLRYETLDGADVERVMKGENLTKPTVSDLLASEQQRRVEARKEEERRNPKPEGPGLGSIPQPG